VGHDAYDRVTEQLLPVAVAAADAARAPALAHFRTHGLTVDDKAGGAGFDPVTAADRAAEAAIRSVLSSLRPRDAVLGEEEGGAFGADGRITWVLDPIDGTRAYISGAPTWGVLIAAHDGARPVLGVLDQPFTRERLIGVATPEGRRAEWRRDDEVRPLAVRPCAGLSSATLFTTFPEVGAPAERAGFEAARDRARLTRYGLDCYAYGLLAMGCVDLVIEAGLQPYDIQALIPIIEGAGGVVTDWEGGDCQMGGRVVAAGDARVHAEALDLLRGR
jgi:histidinol phosphatase-like enzyme (inositol monophosphatase family)